MVQSGVEFTKTHREEYDYRKPHMTDIDLNRQRHYDAKYGFKRSEVVRAIKVFRTHGKPYAQIATYLNEQGYRSPEGKAFHSMTVKRLEEDA